MSFTSSKTTLSVCAVDTGPSGERKDNVVTQGRRSSYTTATESKNKVLQWSSRAEHDIILLTHCLTVFSPSGTATAYLYCLAAYSCIDFNSCVAILKRFFLLWSLSGRPLYRNRTTYCSKSTWLHPRTSLLKWRSSASKNQFRSTYSLISACANRSRLLRRPVKCLNDRTEHFSSEGWLLGDWSQSRADVIAVSSKLSHQSWLKWRRHKIVSGLRRQSARRANADRYCRRRHRQRKNVSPAVSLRKLLGDESVVQFVHFILSQRNNRLAVGAVGEIWQSGSKLTAGKTHSHCKTLATFTRSQSLG